MIIWFGSSVMVELSDSGMTIGWVRVTIVDMVDELGRWKWCLLEHVLPYEILIRLAAIKSPFGNSYDQRGWLPSLDKKFSAIVVFRGISRVKTFLWLVCHGNVLTNDERGRRHLTIDRGCHVCGAGIENIDHILRWCPLAFSLWNSLVLADKFEEFLQLSIKDWIFADLSMTGNFAVDATNWDLLFAYILWNLWKRRNDVVFESHVVYRESILQQSKRMTNLPTLGWCKLNTDGAVHKYSQLASYGGRVGICSALEAELWGIFEGLLTAWLMDIRCLVVETDYLEAYHLLQNSATSYGCFTLMSHISELLTRPWTILFSHIVREGNVLVDTMAKMEVDEIFMCYRFCLPPYCCLDRLGLEAAVVSPGSWPS
ncbi:hypothetical protein GQ457_04G022740 [Hibiscus cannabinus]